MAKAHLTKDGVKITIEGTAEEVASMAAQLSAPSCASDVQPKGRHPTTRRRVSSTPITLIDELTNGGFFRQPRELGAIKKSLEEQGHFYPATSLSPALLRLVRKRHLRRIKEKGRWMYVQ